MRATRWLVTSVALLVAAPALAQHTGAVDVELWTDKGNDAVYQPGDGMQVSVRSSEDGYLMVYEIDTEGYVRLLWPTLGSRGFVEGRETLQFPTPESNLELVVESAMGQGYLVALISNQPFRDMPWYLRPYDMQAEELGYEGEVDESQGVTREGKIVGDPFVAMERIRRAVLADPDDEDSFGTAYSTYYVHQRVNYPRYLCNDCHRPEHWAWWDGWDPYYSTCSVFAFRVNWGWYWGPTYWFGTVPYYYYVVRNDCPPQYQMYASHGCYSSWNGWTTWQTVMGTSTRRYKSAPPPDYIPPDKYKDGGRLPGKAPGLMTGRDVAVGRNGGLRPTSFRTRDGSGSILRDAFARREQPNGRLRDASGGLTKEDGRRGMSRRGDGAVERPREVARGGLRRPDGRGGRDDNREPSRVQWGNDRRDEGGLRWVGRGRAAREGSEEGYAVRRLFEPRGRAQSVERPREVARPESRVERRSSQPRHEAPPPQARENQGGGDRASVGRSGFGNGGGRSVSGGHGGGRGGGRR